MNAFNFKILFAITAYLINTIIVAEGVQLNYLFPRVNNHHTRQHFEINQTQLLKSANFGWSVLTKQHNGEHILSDSRIQVQNDSISQVLLIDGKPSALQTKSDQVAQAITIATTHLKDFRCKMQGILSDKECMKYIRGVRLPESELLNRCREIQNEFGLHSYRRLLLPHYRDSVEKADYRSLPLPRDVAANLYYANQDDLSEISMVNRSDEGVLDTKRNVFLAAFTQFIEHDLSKTLIRTMHNGKGIECCDDYTFAAIPRYTHSSCMPLMIGSNDKHFKPKRIGCLNYVRSAIHAKCNFGHVDQANGATNAFDLSQLYGSSLDELDKLKVGERGLLKTSGTEEESFLREANANHCLKYRNNNSTFCYKAGDVRVNVNPYVTIMYTIFLRSHNRIATKLAEQFPSLSDKYIFFKARELNIAIYQKIVYEEWAKVFLGNENLSLLNQKYTDYDNVNGVSNEFGTAAIPVYNSLYPGDLHLDGQPDLKLEDVFYRPIDLSKNNTFNQIVRSLFNQRAMAMDSGYVDDLAHKYFQSPAIGFGLVGTDAMALDNTRGRDHGLSGYVKYLSHCFNRSISVWDDLVGILRPAELNRIKQIYSLPKHVDLIVGLLAELPLNDATVGPTTICIIGEQLLNSKLYDPMFYQKDAALSNEVRHMTAAKLICQTTGIRFVPANIFYVPNNDNELIDCHHL